ncbi:MAG: flippase-like domain-containing protein [Prevotellaceae bacterium]|nr:flippase-like domain-containing protein [Prevotellaceae bacterium]
MKKNKIYRLLFLFVGLLALGIMVYKVGMKEIIEGILKTGWGFLAIIVLWAIIYVFNTLSWYIIIRDGEKKNNKVPFWQVYRVTISGFSINYITPVVALGGEPYRILEMKPYLGTHKATSSVILFSMMHIYTHFIFWMFSILLALIYLRLTLVWSLCLVGLLALLIFVNIYFLKGYKYGLLVKTFRLLGKIPLIKKLVRNINENKQDSLKAIDNQIAHLHSQRRSSFYLSVSMEFVTRILGCVEIYIIALAVSDLFPTLHMNFLDAIIINAGYSLFANLMFFTPMQLGSREGGFLLAFEAVGLPSAPAMIVSIVTRIREFFWILIGLLLMRIGGSKISAEEELEEVPEDGIDILKGENVEKK